MKNSFKLKKKSLVHLRKAKVEDVDGILHLQKQYHIATILEEDKKDGFVTTLFTREQLTNLIFEENGLFIAEKEGEIIAYAMAASWQYWSSWPLFSFMIKGLPKVNYQNQQLDINNSYQYGPICVDKQYRGTGVLEELFFYLREEMSARFPYLITFINRNNPRSLAAHTRKLGLEILKEFEYNQNNYYELICRSKG